MYRLSYLTELLVVGMFDIFIIKPMFLAASLAKLRLKNFLNEHYLDVVNYT